MWLTLQDNKNIQRTLDSQAQSGAYWSISISSPSTEYGVIQWQPFDLCACLSANIGNPKKKKQGRWQVLTRKAVTRRLHSRCIDSESDQFSSYFSFQHTTSTYDTSLLWPNPHQVLSVSVDLAGVGHGCTSLNNIVLNFLLTSELPDQLQRFYYLFEKVKLARRLSNSFSHKGLQHK